MEDLNARELRNFYEKHTQMPVSPATGRMLQYRDRVFARTVGKPPRRILEIGAGYGGLLRILVARGHKVLVVDLSTARLRALPLPPEAGVAKGTADAVMLPFPDSSLDVVIAAEVLEHLPEYPSAIAEVSRVLRPGGLFLASVPFEETLQELLCPKCLQFFPLNGHLHSFTESGFRQELRSKGFRASRAHIGPSFVSRELWKRIRFPGLFEILLVLDRVLSGRLRASDTWMFFAAKKT